MLLHKNKLIINRQGFTFIEMILYVAIVSMFLTAVVGYGIQASYGRIKSNAQKEVSQNLRLVTDRLQFEIRNANGVNSVTPTSLSLSLADSDRNPTVFDLSNDRIRIGYGTSGDCPVANPCYITSNKIIVTELLFEDLSLLDQTTSTIKFSISVETVNLSGRAEFDESSSFSSSAETRAVGGP